MGVTGPRADDVAETAYFSKAGKELSFVVRIRPTSSWVWSSDGCGVTVSGLGTSTLRIHMAGDQVGHNAPPPGTGRLLGVARKRHSALWYVPTVREGASARFRGGARWDVFRAGRIIGYTLGPNGPAAALTMLEMPTGCRGV